MVGGRRGGEALMGADSDPGNSAHDRSGCCWVRLIGIYAGPGTGLA
jgi:hypothetical protein